MENNFYINLKSLADKYSQKYISEKTGFSQSSINNYLKKGSEPSIQFLIALKNAFDICVDDFLFEKIDTSVNEDNNSQYYGNYLIYYFNNSSYKGEIHNNVLNTLNYGVLSIIEGANNKSKTDVYLLPFIDRSEAIKYLKVLNTKNHNDIRQEYLKNKNYYEGEINTNDKNIFINLTSKNNDDCCYIILNNPTIKYEYIGGLGTINSVSRGREQNPCVQYIILSKKQIDKPDGEIYNALSLDFANVDFDTPVEELTSLFKRLYLEKNEFANELNENQKQAIIENKLKYYFNEIVDANMFRFGKITNYEDDVIYRLLKEGINV